MATAQESAEQKAAAEKAAEEAKAAAQAQAAEEKAAAEKAAADAKAAEEAKAAPKTRTSKGHTVTGAAVVLATKDKAERYLYRGALVPDGVFTEDSIKHAISVGLIEKNK